MEEVTAFAGRGPYHSVPVPLLPLQDAAEKRAWLEPPKTTLPRKHAPVRLHFQLSTPRSGLEPVPALMRGISTGA